MKKAATGKVKNQSRLMEQGQVVPHLLDRCPCRMPHASFSHKAV
jgi:hypothetical protein